MTSRVYTIVVAPSAYSRIGHPELTHISKESAVSVLDQAFVTTKIEVVKAEAKVLKRIVWWNEHEGEMAYLPL